MPTGTVVRQNHSSCALAFDRQELVHRDPVGVVLHSWRSDRRIFSGDTERRHEPAFGDAWTARCGDVMPDRYGRRPPLQ